MDARLERPRPGRQEIGAIRRRREGDRRVHQQQAVAVVITRADLPKFASNNRTTGTPEENKATVAGSIAYFGTYDASDADKMLTMHIEGSTFPNWTGTDQKRTIELSGDQLKFINKNPSHGPGRPHRDVEARQGSSNDGGSQGGGAQ